MLEYLQNLLEEMEMSPFISVDWRDDLRYREKYPIIVTPKYWEKRFIGIIFPGAKEQAGIWSAFLVKAKRLEEGTMFAYFREFYKRDWGLLSLNPYFSQNRKHQQESIFQLESVLSHLHTNQKFGLIGFSIGGRYLVDYACRNELESTCLGAVLLDPVAPNRDIGKKKIPQYLQEALVCSAESHPGKSLGRLAAEILDISVCPISCYHPELPHHALPQVMRYWDERVR